MDVLDSEKTKELIDNVAHLIVDRGLSEIFIIYVKSMRPMANMFGYIVGAGYYPFAPIFGESIQNYASLLTFNTRENLNSILKRVEELEKDKLNRDNFFQASQLQLYLNSVINYLKDNIRKIGDRIRSR